MFFPGKDKIILDLDFGEKLDMIDLCESSYNHLEHPLAEGFLYAKWHSLRNAYMLNCLCYVLFITVISGLIQCKATISGYDKSGLNGQCEGWSFNFSLYYCITVCGAVYLTVREIVQFKSLRKKFDYLTFDNALDWAIILLVYTYLISIWINTHTG